MAKKNTAVFIIIILLIILSFLLAIVIIFLNALNSVDNIENVTDNVIVSVPSNNKKIKSISEIIESSGSKFLGKKDTTVLYILVSFKYNLFDENGNSKKDYFYDIVNQICEIKKKTFYIEDADKKIIITAKYNLNTGEHTILINDLENYYDTVDGDLFIELSSNKQRELSSLLLSNELIKKIGTNSSFYKSTELEYEEKDNIGNNYFSFRNGEIIAKLQYAKALNIIFRDGYKESFAKDIYVKTDLNTILQKYPNPNFGSVREGYLGYITEYAYIFFYNDEVSVYPYEYKDNNYFDKYITDFCKSGNFEKLVSDFTTDWTSYFEKEYDLESGNFTISFPTRGLKIDMINKDPVGITIYNNYKLSDSTKELIKSKKITYKNDEDLVNITEKYRRQSM